MFDPHQNFAYSTVATAPSPALSGTTLVLESGTADLFPDPSAQGYNVTVWPAGENPLASNAEIVRVIEKNGGDTLTVVRAQEGSSARTILAGDQIAVTITAKVITDVEEAMVFVLDGNNNIHSSNAATPLGTGNFFAGLDAGLGHDASMNNSIFIGGGAGSGATVALLSVFIGFEAGLNAEEAFQSVFIGASAGSSTNAYNSLFFGAGAGAGATDASGSVFIGMETGSGATNAIGSLFIGGSAGFAAINASGSTFIGSNAGSGAENASQALFLGEGAGNGAINATQSLFFGAGAGNGAENARYAIFIGNSAGYLDPVDNTVSGNSLVVGYYAGTGGFKDSIAIGTGVLNSAEKQLNIGNVLYATNLYKNDGLSGTIPAQTSNPMYGSSVGVGMVPPATPTTLGTEKLTNGTFTGSAGSWTLATGFTYSGNLVRHSVNGTGTLKQTSAAMATPLVPGEYYSLTFTLSNYLGSFVGSVRPAVGGNATPMTSRTAAGTYTEIFQALTTDDLTFIPTNTSRFQIDDVTLKKVTGAGDLHVGGRIFASEMYVSVPATPTSAGVPGQKAIDTTNKWIYEVIAVNTWRRYRYFSFATESLIFVSNGDANGIVFFIASFFGLYAFTNPTPSRTVVTLSSLLNGQGSYLTDRDTLNDVATTNVANSWAAIDLGAGRTAVIDKYALQNRNHPTDNARAIRNWKLQGSNNPASNSVADLAAATWVDIDSRVADTTMATTQFSWASFTPNQGNANAYRWLRILQNGTNASGDNYLCIGEFEFYGTLVF